MAGVAFAVEGDGVGFATESYAASALYTTLANRSGARWRIKAARRVVRPSGWGVVNSLARRGCGPVGLVHTQKFELF
jgi:hypothetical protein